MKDFLFLNYNWVPNSTFLFKNFEKKGHSIDIIGEEQIRDFIPQCGYKNVVIYLHNDWTFPLTNNIIDNYCPDSFLIQHDDTDCDQLQRWSNRKPDLFMQREYSDFTDSNFYGGTHDSLGPRISLETTPVEGFHFPMDSLYDETLQEKKWDVCFIGRPTNHRRNAFINKLIELSKGSLNHLKWYIQYDYVPQDDIESRRNNQTHDYYKEIINGSKIGLNFPGNSYDSHRNWELASSKSCIIQPRLKVKSCNTGNTPFTDYVTIQDDFQDLEDKILYALENDRWKDFGQRAFDDYNANHTPERCFEDYYTKVMKYARK
jgi:hypothetical protein